MTKAGAVLSAAVVLVVGSIRPAHAGTAEIKRALHLTAWPTAGSRKERQIQLRADRYFWYCAIYGGDYYRYTQNCTLWPDMDEAARAYLITEPFNFPTSGPHTVISRLIGA
ncbi:hypothetical protein [Embleya sp. NPDC020630]|uniref:hypothetical protein n=1 Tax=Embleya sp. NPDC020630 TaxID=3363979 RepID=UPI0037BA3341